ncbi:MAG: ATP-dependent DNA helicase RecG [Spirochaetes bacterium]|nr:ATP-dependent DNA helicase RecG [Spirochaetota bacterium]
MIQRTMSTIKDLIEQDVKFSKGVGPYFEEILAKKRIHTLFDLVTFFPRDYEDRTKMVTITEAITTPDKNAVVLVEIAGIESLTVNFRTVPKLIVTDGDHVAQAPLFSGRMPKGFEVGVQVVITGKFKRGFKGVQCSISEIELSGGTPASYGRIVALYELTAGLSQKKMRALIHQQMTVIQRALKYDIPSPYKLKGTMCYADALAEMHEPAAFSSLEKAKRTIIFEEFFTFQTMYLAANRPPVLKKAPRYSSIVRMDALKRTLPYTLTGAQERVLGELTADLMSDRQMFRLLQGDVGSGKTIVALLAAMVVVENGYQAALLAPTEVLARQHAATARKLLGDNAVIALLTGTSDDREGTTRDIAEKKCDIIIGTHALLSETVSFASLGLAIIDEQQRFGVDQRNVLLSKGSNVDYLLMTATPIPRSLTMTLFGELDLSVIDEMPPGRIPVKTKSMGLADRSHCYQFLKSRIAKGEQGFVVFPVISESADDEILTLVDEYHTVCADYLFNIPAGMVHGRMPAPERDGTMARFASGELKVLFATSLIEVGIDIPNATTIIIEGAERFGLSQLHQLRGRVGRNGRDGFCYLVNHGELADIASARMKIMCETNDGFKIAETDLEIRGPGEFLGVKQSGLPEFKAGNIIRDADIMRDARAAALRFLADTPAGIADFNARRDYLAAHLQSAEPNV